MNYPKLVSNYTVQILVSLFSVLVLGFLLYKLDTKYILLLLLFGLILIPAILFSKWVISKFGFELEILLLYALLATTFLNAAVYIDLGAFSLLPYRIFYICLMLTIFFKFITNHLDLKWNEVKIKGILYFFAIWLGYSLLSLTWVRDISAGVKNFIFLFIGITIIYLVVLYFKTLKNYVTYLYIWIGMLGLLILIGLWNHLTKNHLKSSAIYYGPEGKKDIPSAVFYNQNDYATYLVIGVFILLAFIRYSKPILHKSIGGILLLLTVYLIYATSSRASLLGVLIGIVGWILLTLSPKIKTIVIVAGLFLACSASIVLFDPIYEKFLAVFNSLNNQLSSQSSISIRLNLMKNASDFLVNTFGFGVGAGNVEYYMEHLATHETGNIYNLHNWWLEILTNFGIFIFVGYVLVYIGLIVYLFHIYMKVTNGQEKMIAEALLTSLIAFSFASISPSTISNLVFYWVFIAFCVGFVNYIRLHYTWNKN